jgi:hypothetical protein
MNITRKRPSKHERLLKALLAQCEFNAVCRTTNKEGWFCLSTKMNNQLIAIKQAIEKKGQPNE